ncbi:MAG: hypothetical protein P8163_22355 [Candidatus Thiodiazotropha sp.]
MIERLQTGTQNAVDVIHRSSATTLSTVEKAQGASQSLSGIVTAISAISDRNTQIASASEEQSAVAQEIDRSVVQISQLAEHSSLASDQINQASSELSQLGESRYNVNGTLVAAHGGVATPWNSLRAVQGCTSVAGTWMCRSDPCPAPPQTHPSRCPTDLFRFNYLRANAMKNNKLNSRPVNLAPTHSH